MPPPPAPGPFMSLTLHPSRNRATESRRPGEAQGCRAKWKESRRGQARGLHQIPGLPRQAQGEGSDQRGLRPAAPRQPRWGATELEKGCAAASCDLGVLTVLEVAGAVSGPVPAPRPGSFVRVIVVVIGVVVGVLVGVVRVVAHHAVYAAGRLQVTERRALSQRRPVAVSRVPSIAGPGRRVASLEPMAGGGSGSAGDPRRASSALACCRRAVAEQQDWRARLRGCGVGRARGGGARVPSALRLVLRAQAQQAEHLPVVLPLDPLAPGGRSRRLLARGLLLASGRRGAAQECAELQGPEQERGPSEAHRCLLPDCPHSGRSLVGEKENGAQIT